MGCCCGCPLNQLRIEIHHQLQYIDMNRGAYIKYKDRSINSFQKIEAGGLVYLTQDELVIKQEGCCSNCCLPSEFAETRSNIVINNSQKNRYFHIFLKNIQDVHITSTFKDNIHQIEPCLNCSHCCGGGDALINIRGINEDGEIHMAFIVVHPIDWISHINDLRNIDFNQHTTHDINLSLEKKASSHKPILIGESPFPHHPGQSFEGEGEEYIQLKDT